jgi:hypothetical protein
MIICYEVKNIINKLYMFDTNKLKYLIRVFIVLINFDLNI